MTINQKFIALYTMLRFELVRMFRISFQVFLPPIITTLLYFLIFSTVIGKRIGSIHELNYGLYIAPGLLMLAVINNVFGNVSTSVFSARFQKFIEELMISPMSHGLIMLGYILGGVARGLIVATLVILVEYFFVDIDIQHLPLTFLIIILVSILFALIGFTNGILAHNFEGITIIPLFVLTPLTYLGGVFYSIDMLPTFWQRVAHFNPILYMISAMRQAITGQEQHIQLSVAITLIITVSICVAYMNLFMLKKGIGLRN